MACLDDNFVLELVCGALDAEQQRIAQDHLDACADCRDLVARVAGGDDTREWEQLEIGARVGRYEVSDVLGAGAMGFVFAAKDPELGRTVALKLLRASGAEASALRPRLLREAQALAKLSHPNVVAVHDVGAFGDHLFVALEWVDGGTLTEWLRAPRSVREIVRAFRQAGEGLAAAHAAGLVHRDFKPDNVLVGSDGRVRVTDFGLAAHQGALADAGEAPVLDGKIEKLTQTGMLVGTPGYIAPEQLDGRAADVRSDQFAFCVALFEALYGHRPFAGDDWATLRASLLAGEIDERPGSRRVPRWVRRIVRRGLRRAPDERWPTMRALLDAIDRGSPITPRRLALAAAALAVAAGVGVVAMRHERERACVAAGDAWSAVWTDDMSRALGARLGADHAEVAGTVDRAFHSYGAAWSQMTRESCLATRVEGTQTSEVFDARERCLAERRDYAVALGHALLEGPPPRADGALEVASSLPSVEECANARALLATAPGEETAEHARRRADLQARMARTTIEGYITAAGDPKAFQALADEAHALGLPVLESRALLLRARYETDEVAEENALQRSALAAFAARDDAALADAWARLSFHAGFHAARYQDSERWGQYAQGALDRLGGDPVREAELLVSRGFTLIFEGRAEEAQVAMRRARELFVAARGPDYWRIGVADYGAGGAALAMGRLDEALDLYRRAKALAKKVGGATSQNYITASDNEATALALLGRADEAIAIFGELDRTSATSSWRQQQIGLALRTVGRFDEALAHDQNAMALAVTEKQDGPRAAYASLATGLDLLALHRAREALPLVAQALDQLAGHSAPEDLAGAQFAVARAVRDTGGDAAKARTLATSARDALRPLADKYGSQFRKQLAEIDAWLAVP